MLLTPRCPECETEVLRQPGKIVCPNCRTPLSRSKTEAQPRILQRVKDPVLRNDNRISNTLQAEVTFVSDFGVLTICGACGILTSDHNGLQERTYTAKLLTFIRTDECKFCHQPMDEDRCPVNVFHKRLYLPRSKRVASCLECSIKGDTVVQPAEFKALPELFIRQWKSLLATADRGQYKRLVDTLRAVNIARGRGVTLTLGGE